MKTLFRNYLILGVFLQLASCVKPEMEEEINYIRLYSEGIETKAEIDVQSDQIKEGAQVGVFVYNTTSSEIVDKAENNCHTAVYTDGVYNLTTRDSTGM